MLALVDFPTEPEDADVERIGKDAVNPTQGKRLVSHADKPPLLDYPFHVRAAVVTRCVGLEHAADERCTFLVEYDGSGLRIVHVARWRHVGIHAVTELLADAAPDLLRQMVYLVLRNGCNRSSAPA